MLAMMMREGEPPVSERPARQHDPRHPYSPQRIYALLRAYPYLDARLSERDDPRPGKSTRTLTADSEKNRIDRKIDLDRALTWLAMLDNDPVAAELIDAYYRDPRAAHEKSEQTVARVSQWSGMGQSTIYRHINRGVHDLARFLGYVEPSVVRAVDEEE